MLFLKVVVLILFSSISVHAEEEKEWHEYFSMDMQKFYYNAKLQISSWNKPETISSGIDMDSTSQFGAHRQPPPSAPLKFFYNHYSPRSQPDPKKITLTLQMDIRRLSLLERHGSHWKGPMSVAILIFDHEWPKIHDFVSNMSPNLKNNMALHIVVAAKQWKFYPINKMRNAALDHAKTKWVFILDSDEDTIFDMETYYAEVERAEKKLTPQKMRKTVLALASWQWGTETEGKYPETKKDLKVLYDMGLADCKAPHYYSAYKPPSFSMAQWLKNTEIRRTDYGDAYEAYFIAIRNSFPRFDPRFAGFGGDKSFLELNMAANGYSFYLLPNVFTFVPDKRSTAMNHAPPSDPEFIQGVWNDFGQKYGCSDCKSYSCVQKCPWIVHPNKGSDPAESRAKKVANAPVVAEKAPVVAEKAPVVAEKAPVVAEKAPVVAEKAPVVAEKATVVAEKAPVVAEKAPVVAEKAPATTADVALVPVVVEKATPNVPDVVVATKTDTTATATANTNTNVPVTEVNSTPVTNTDTVVTNEKENSNKKVESINSDRSLLPAPLVVPVAQLIPKIESLNNKQETIAVTQK